MSWVRLAEVCTVNLIWHRTYFSVGDCRKEAVCRHASPGPVGPTTSNDFSWSSHFARKCICIAVPKALPGMSLSWKNQRKRCPKDAIKKVSLLTIHRTTIGLRHGVIANHNKKKNSPPYLKGWQRQKLWLVARSGRAAVEGPVRTLCFRSGPEPPLLAVCFYVTWPGVGLLSALNLARIWPHCSIYRGIYCFVFL